jgi:Ca2+-binding RTX toxin-like protein
MSAGARSVALVVPCRVLAHVLLVAAMAVTGLVATATPAAAAVGCSFDPLTGRVRVDATGLNEAVLSRDVGGRLLVLPAGVPPVACAGANVSNTDQILVSGAGQVTVDTANGQLAPGRTREAVGQSEIEIANLSGTALVYEGSNAVDLVAVGSAAGIDAGRDGDEDIVAFGVGTERWIGLHTWGGNDVVDLSAAPGGVHYETTPGTGDDLVIGSAYDDLVWDGPGNDIIHSGAGDDVLETADYPPQVVLPDDDIISAGPGVDHIWAGYGGSVVDAGPGDDVVIGGGGDDNRIAVIDGRVVQGLYGGDGNDVIYGSDGDDVIDGGPGDDQGSRVGPWGILDHLAGGPGADLVRGGAGDDYVVGDSGSDVLEGGPGNDTVGPGWAEPGEGDVVRGGPGNDMLSHAHGPNRVEGGEGDDWLSGGHPGPGDFLSGGPGVDHVDYWFRQEALVITIGTPGDDGAVGEGDTVSADIEQVTGGEGDDLIVGTGAAETLIGNGGADSLLGLGGNDHLVGNGEDLLSGGAGDDRLAPFAGGDVAGGDGQDTVDFAQYTGTRFGIYADLEGDRDDCMAAAPCAVRSDVEHLDGSSGDDELHGDARANTIRGMSRYDEIHGGGGDDLLDGGGYNDRLFGEDGDDRLLGGDGDDVLEDGPGADHSDGGTGWDLMVQPADPDSGDRFVGGDQRDEVSYRARSEPVQVELGDPRAPQGAAGEGDSIALDVENATGGSAGDRLIGDGRDNALDGAEGDDHLAGGGGEDSLLGSDGDDVIDEGNVPNGPDHPRGNDGTDTVDYSSRTGPIVGTPGTLEDDGAPGEMDLVATDIEIVLFPGDRAPVAPADVQAAGGRGAVTASWSPLPVTAGPVHSYSIVVRQGGLITGWVVVPGDGTSASISGLRNDVPAAVQVAAVTDAGWGPYSAAASATPSAGLPAPGRASAPSYPGVWADDGHVSVAWSAPSSDGGAAITGYSVVAVDRTTGALRAWRNVGVDVRSVALPGLGATVDVHVMAMTSSGFGSSAGPLRPLARMAPREVPGTPAWLSLATAGSSVTAYWGAATERGTPVGGYSIVAFQGGRVHTWLNVGTDRRSVTMTGLLPGQPLAVHVMAHSSSGFGAATATVA